MRRLVRWTIVAFGIAALVRWLKRRRADVELGAPSAQPVDPAEALRRKLAEQREVEEPGEAPEPEPSVAERRAEVHEQARAALDEMQSSVES